MASRGITMALDGFTPENSVDLVKKIKILKASVRNSKKLLQSFTHLVCDTIFCSDKFYAACSQGAWIVSPQFVEDSFAFGQWLPEREYVHSSRDQRESPELVAAAQRWRWRWEMFKERPFSNWTVAVLIEGDEGIKYKKILSLGGATVKSLVLPMEDNQNVSDLTYVFMDQAHYQSVAELQDFGLICIRHTFITDTILKDEELDPFEYLIKFTNSSDTEERVDTPNIFESDESSAPTADDTTQRSNRSTPVNFTTCISQTDQCCISQSSIGSAVSTSSVPGPSGSRNSVCRIRKSVRISHSDYKNVEVINYSKDIEEMKVFGSQSGTLSGQVSEDLSSLGEAECSYTEKTTALLQNSLTQKKKKLQVQPMDPNRPVDLQRESRRVNMKRKLDAAMASQSSHGKKQKSAKRHEKKYSQDSCLSQTAALPKSIYVHDVSCKRRETLLNDGKSISMAHSKQPASLQRIGSPRKSTSKPKANMTLLPQNHKVDIRDTNSPMKDSGQASSPLKPSLSASVHLYGINDVDQIGPEAQENSKDVFSDPDLNSQSQESVMPCSSADPNLVSVKNTTKTLASSNKVHLTHNSQTSPRVEENASHSEKNPSLTISLPPSPFIHNRTESIHTDNAGPSERNFLSSSWPGTKSPSRGKLSELVKTTSSASPSLSLTSATNKRTVQASLQNFGFSSTYAKGQRSTSKKLVKAKQSSSVSSPTIRNLAKQISPLSSQEKATVKQEPVDDRWSPVKELESLLTGISEDYPVIISSDDEENPLPGGLKTKSGGSHDVQEQEATQERLSPKLSSNDEQGPLPRKTSEKSRLPSQSFEMEKYTEFETHLVEQCEERLISKTGSLSALPPSQVSRVKKSLASAFNSIAKKSDAGSTPKSHCAAESSPLSKTYTAESNAALHHSTGSSVCEILGSNPQVNYPSKIDDPVITCSTQNSHNDVTTAVNFEEPKERAASKTSPILLPPEKSTSRFPFIAKPITDGMPSANTYETKCDQTQYEQLSDYMEMVEGNCVQQPAEYLENANKAGSCEPHNLSSKLETSEMTIKKQGSIRLYDDGLKFQGKGSIVMKLSDCDPAKLKTKLSVSTVSPDIESKSIVTEGSQCKDSFNEVRESVPVLYGQWMEAARELGLNDSAISHGRPTQYLLPTPLLLAQLVSIAGEGISVEQDVAGQASAYLQGWLHLHPPCNMNIARIYGSALRIDGPEHDPNFLFDWIKKCVLASEGMSDVTQLHALLRYFVSVLELNFNSFAKIGDKKLLQNCLVVSWLWKSPYGVFHTSRTCQLVKLLEKMLQSASVKLLEKMLQSASVSSPRQLDLTAIESVCSLIGLAAECIRLNSNGWDQTVQSFTSDAVIVIATDMCRSITTCMSNFSPEIIHLLLNFIKPPWLRALVISIILSSTFNPYLLSENIQVQGLSLCRIVSQYFFLVPNVSSTVECQTSSRANNHCLESGRKNGNPSIAMNSNGEKDEIIKDMKRISLLLKKRNHKGETPLHTACIKNDVVMLEKLLSHPDADINVQDANGWTPLHEACNHGSLKCVELLLRHVPVASDGGGINKDVKDGIANRDSKHHRKVDFEDANGKEMASMGPNVLRKADINAAGPQKITPLHDAVLNNRVSVCRLLLQYGGQRLLKARTILGYTALDLAETDEMRKTLENFSMTLNLSDKAETESERFNLDSSQAEEDLLLFEEEERAPLASLYTVLVGDKSSKSVNRADFSHFLSLLSTLFITYCEATGLILGKATGRAHPDQAVRIRETNDRKVMSELPLHFKLLKRHMRKLTVMTDFEALKPQLELVETICCSIAT